MIEIHGHRGAMARMPENTMNAYRYAMQVGADGIEVDIALTKDGVFVLNHDRSIEGKLIKDLTWDEIQKFEIGNKASDQFPDQIITPHSRVPSLEAFLQFFDPYPQVKLNLEIKTCAFHPDETREPMDFAKGILGLLEKYSINKERVFFQSFDPRMIMALRSEGSTHEISYLMDTWSDDFAETAEALEVKTLSPRVTELTEERCKAITDAGLSFFTWPTNDKREWENMLAWGAKGIITDDPEAALDWRDSRPKN